MTLMTPQVCQTDDGVCFVVETARPLFDVFHGPPPLESARKLIEAHDDLVTLAVCTYEDQRILRDFPGGFPRLETLGYMDSGMSHDLFRHLFFKIRTTMPKLKALAVSTDSVDYDADGWDVFAAVPETIKDVYLQFEACRDRLTRNKRKTADHIAKFLPRTATVHVLYDDICASIVVDWLNPSVPRTNVLQRERDTLRFGPWGLSNRSTKQDAGMPYVSRRGRGA